ncbi:DNA polymerase III subunit chi [Neisseria zoodegmatis]|uniref:DNA polymerase III subunit chi n=1 Tax=Neisseria zoodegmatis TaxID=326523 RepID=A0A378WGL8_9NEIS|nr:DNA polymerase III subunit chi [Neisseria zoodegmatis]SUA35855.1 DNA polymerase III subunit chi [Neisseria zoodegmatis]
MPKATFYTHVGNPYAFTCRLAARAMQSGSRVLVWADSPEAVARLDIDLWQFEPTGFLAHEVWETGQDCPRDVPLVLACGNTLPEVGNNLVVLNLAPDFWCDAPIPPARVLEIVGSNLEELDEARERFRAYRSSGFEIEHHNMQGKA